MADTILDAGHIAGRKSVVIYAYNASTLQEGQWWVQGQRGLDCKTLFRKKKKRVSCPPIMF